MIHVRSLGTLWRVAFFFWGGGEIWNANLLLMLHNGIRVKAPDPGRDQLPTEPGACVKVGTVLQCHRTSTEGQQRTRSGWEGIWELSPRPRRSALPRHSPATKMVTSVLFSEDGAVSRKAIALQLKPKCFTSSFQ